MTLSTLHKTNTQADLHELMATRRTVFQFKPQPVDTDIVERALTAAHWAPNHKHTWPWRFMLPGPHMQAQLVDYFSARLIEKLARRQITGAEAERILHNSRERQRQMPLQIIVYATQTGTAHQQREDYASACCAVQNLTLSLWADGVASGWKTFDSEAAYTLTGLDPDHHVLVGLIQAGYALNETPRPGKRPPLSDHIIHTA